MKYETRQILVPQFPALGATAVVYWSGMFYVTVLMSGTCLELVGIQGQELQTANKSTSYLGKGKTRLELHFSQTRIQA